MQNKKKILLIEDETDFRDAVKMRLEANGYEIIEAKDGLTAFDLARTHSPDLIILDIIMPKMDGLEVARQLKADEKSREIPIVMLTVRAQVGDKDVGIAAGADAYMLKPFNPQELLETVSELIS